MDSPVGENSCVEIFMNISEVCSSCYFKILSRSSELSYFLKSICNVNQGNEIRFKFLSSCLGEINISLRLITLTCIFKLFQIPRRIAHHSESFFHAKYECVIFFPARPDLPIYYVQGLKITLK